jgi:hypothetical protein
MLQLVIHRRAQQLGINAIKELTQFLQRAGVFRQVHPVTRSSEE